MKKPLLNILYFLVLAIISFRLQNKALDWVASKESSLVWCGAITATLCIIATFISGWNVGKNLTIVAKYLRDKNPS